MRFCILLTILSLAASALEDPQARLDAIQHEMETKVAVYARDWLGRARLTPLALPVVNLTDCKPSEAKALADARIINDRLTEARRVLALKDDHQLALFFTPPAIREITAAQALPAEAVHKSAAAQSR